MPVQIVTDSTATLPPDVAAAHGIHVIPLHVRFGSRDYRAGVDLTADQFFEMLAASPLHPSTSQPNPTEFETLYSEVTRQGDPVVSIHISEVLSGTIASARQAVQALPNRQIHIVNSETASMPLGLIAVEAAKAARAGADAPTIVRLVEGLKPRTKVAFVVATLEYLRRGGRIGGAQAFLGGLLSVKPVLHIHGGRVDPVTRVRTFAKAHEAIGAYVREHAPRGVDHGAIIHARAEEQRAALAALVQARYAPTGDTYADITIDPVVGTYTGPGAFGFAFVARA